MVTASLYPTCCCFCALTAFGSAAVWGILAFSLGPKPSKKVALLLLYAVHSPPPSPRTIDVLFPLVGWLIEEFVYPFNNG